MAPPNLAPNDIAVYALFQGKFVVQIGAEIDIAAGTATISRPDVTITSDLFAAKTSNTQRVLSVKTPQSNENVTPEVGFLLGSKDSPENTCVNGIPGEIHELDNHFFTINIDANTDCAHVELVANLLQEALVKHQDKYPQTDGTKPLDHLTSENRMAVYIQNISSGAEAAYSYKSLNGYILVNTTSTGDTESQRADIFHEVFHAVQNDFMNMMLSYYTNEFWWMEASAEYVGYTSSRTVVPPLGDLLLNEMINAKRHFLSLNILDSWNNNQDSYAYSTLIYRAENTTPGYILNTLQSYVGGGYLLYKGLLDTVSFPDQYEDWLQELLETAFVVGNPSPWLSGNFVESTNWTKIETPESFDIGEPQYDATFFTTEAERYEQSHVFGPVTIEKMTTRFYRVQAVEGITPDRSLHVKVTGDVNVLLVKQKGDNLIFSSLPSVGQTISGLGSTVEYLWIAIYNPSRNFPTSATLSLDLAQSPGTCSARGLPGPEVVAGVVGSWQRCDNGQKYTWVEAQAYCEDLELDGHTDWYLPYKDALKSLVVCTDGTATPLADTAKCGTGYTMPTIDPQYSCQNDDYWSSSSYDSPRAWKVEFFSGRAIFNTKTLSEYVRCMR